MTRHLVLYVKQEQQMQESDCGVLAVRRCLWWVPPRHRNGYDLLLQCEADALSTPSGSSYAGWPEVFLYESQGPLYEGGTTPQSLDAVERQVKAKGPGLRTPLGSRETSRVTVRVSRLNEDSNTRCAHEDEAGYLTLSSTAQRLGFILVVLPSFSQIACFGVCYCSNSLPRITF